MRPKYTRRWGKEKDYAEVSEIRGEDGRCGAAKESLEQHTDADDAVKDGHELEQGQANEGIVHKRS